MNNLTKILLGGTALCALTTAPAMAGDVARSLITALHAGNLVNKTAIHDPKRTHLTYTYAGGYTYVPASDLNVNVQLLSTYWKWNSSGNICSNPKTKIKITKKSRYGKTTTGTITETSGTCVIVYHGDNYKLTNPAGEGGTDSFVSSMSSKFENSGVKYKATLNLDMGINIGE
jgi:hypothetical protein